MKLFPSRCCILISKGGKFNDIGCKISHTDIRFLRVCLAGKLSKNTRIDYIEVSAEGSALNGKLR